MNKFRYLVLVAGLLLISAWWAYTKFKTYKTRQYSKLYPTEFENRTNILEIDNHAVWFIGDSRVSMWNETGIDLPDSISVYNFGIGGQTSAQVTERLLYMLEYSTPRVVLLQVGINDLKNIGLFPELPISDRCIANIKRAIAACNEKNIPVIYTSIFPVGKIELLRRLIWDSTTEDAIVRVNNAIRNICDTTDAVYFDSNTVLLGPENKLRTTFEKDFLHLNEDGYNALNSAISPYISSLISGND